MAREEHGIQCIPYSSRIISEMLLENHTMTKFVFFHLFKSFSNNLILCYFLLQEKLFLSLRMDLVSEVFLSPEQKTGSTLYTCKYGDKSLHQNKSW